MSIVRAVLMGDDWGRASPAGERGGSEKNLATPLSASRLLVAEHPPGGGGKAMERATWIVPGKSFLNQVRLLQPTQYRTAPLLEPGGALRGAGGTAAWWVGALWMPVGSNERMGVPELTSPCVQK